MNSMNNTLQALTGKMLILFLPWLTRTPGTATGACPAICLSVTGSGSTRYSAGAHLSSDLRSCSAEEDGAAQQLAARHSQSDSLGGQSQPSGSPGCGRWPLFQQGAQGFLE